MENTQLTTVSKEVIETLNSTVISVISANGMDGFEKAFLIAEATAKLKNALTAKYMAPIMQLQGNRLGFRTDKDASGGYEEHIVKNCLIEAVLTGVQPFGNQFNIIAGNCYITKEGFGHLLKNYPGLDYDIIPTLPRINDAKTSAAVVMKITWTINSKTETKEIDFAVIMNSFMKADAVIGKATRKARAWLFWRLTGVEVGEGDVTDADAKVVSSKLNTPTREELMKMLEEAEPYLKKKDFDDAKRILDNKEENSYAKLYRELKAKGNEQNP